MRTITKEKAKEERLWPITTEININSEKKIMDQIENSMLGIDSAAWVEIRNGIVECWRGGKRSYSRGGSE